MRVGAAVSPVLALELPSAVRPAMADNARYTIREVLNGYYSSRER